MKPFFAEAFEDSAYMFLFMHRKFLNRKINASSHDWTGVVHFLSCEFLLSSVACLPTQKTGYILHQKNLDPW